MYNRRMETTNVLEKHVISAQSTHPDGVCNKLIKIAVWQGMQELYCSPVRMVVQGSEVGKLEWHAGIVSSFIILRRLMVCHYNL